MTVNESELLKSGFTDADLKIIKNNIESYGGTLHEAVVELSNRFRVLLWIVSAFTLVFVFLLLFSTKPYILGGGLSLLFCAVIVTFIQPPVLAWKSWRYWRSKKGLA
jgi:membrane protein YdbS with pleckstrin-like domain